MRFTLSSIHSSWSTSKGKLLGAWHHGDPGDFQGERQTDRHTHTHTHKATTQQEVCSWEREVQQTQSRAAAGGRKDQCSVGNPRRLHGGSEISPGGLQSLVQIHCKTKEHMLKLWGEVGVHRAPCGQRTTGKEWQQMSPGLACEGPLTGSHP